MISRNFCFSEVYVSALYRNIKYVTTVDHRHKHLGNSGVEVFGSSTNSVALGRLLNVLVAQCHA